MYLQYLFDDTENSVIQFSTAPKRIGVTVILTSELT